MSTNIYEAYSYCFSDIFWKNKLGRDQFYQKPHVNQDFQNQKNVNQKNVTQQILTALTLINILRQGTRILFHYTFFSYPADKYLFKGNSEDTRPIPIDVVLVTLLLALDKQLPGAVLSRKFLRSSQNSQENIQFFFVKVAGFEKDSIPGMFL